MNTTTRRYEDMSPHGELFVHLQDDGDAIIGIFKDGKFVEVEFCTYVGGGQSSNTRKAIYELFKAIEKDNEETKQYR